MVPENATLGVLWSTGAVPPTEPGKDSSRPLGDRLLDDIPKVPEMPDAMGEHPSPKALSAAFGRHMWSAIHILALAYPENPDLKYQQAVKNFFVSLSLFFPCEECRVEMPKLLEKRPIPTESRNAFRNWTCQAHNDVNKRLGKPLVDCDTWESLWEKKIFPCDTCAKA